MGDGLAVPFDGGGVVFFGLVADADTEVCGEIVGIVLRVDVDGVLFDGFVVLAVVFVVTAQEEVWAEELVFLTGGVEDGGVCQLEYFESPVADKFGHELVGFEEV